MNRQHGNIYMIQCGQIPDAPHKLYSLLFLSCLEKPNLGILPCLWKYFLKMAQHTALHFCNHFPLKRWHSSVLMRSAIAFSHYASLLRVGVLSAAPVAVEKIGIKHWKLLFILHALFLQDFLHISFLFENWLLQGIVKFTSCFFSYILSKIGLKTKYSFYSKLWPTIDIFSLSSAVFLIIGAFYKSLIEMLTT